VLRAKDNQKDESIWGWNEHWKISKQRSNSHFSPTQSFNQENALINIRENQQGDLILEAEKPERTKYYPWFWVEWMEKSNMKKKLEDRPRIRHPVRNGAVGVGHKKIANEERSRNAFEAE
jgi:hypothetical protein